jgi:hypothetical protein
MYDYKWDDEQYQAVFGPQKKNYHLGDTLVFLVSLVGFVVVFFFL